MTLRVTPADIVADAESSGRPGLLVKAQSWGRVLLGDVARVVNGAPYDSSHFNVEQRGMPLVRIRDIGARKFSTWYDGEWAELQRVRRGDLLIGMDGNFMIDQWHLDDALLNQRVCRIDVDEGRMNRRFLELVLQGYLDAIWDRTSSTTVKHLSSKTITQIPLPAPPLDEQCCIVEILEEHLSSLDAADADLRKAVRRSARLSSALVDSMLPKWNASFEDDGQGWRWVTVDELAEHKRSNVVIGPFGSDLLSSDYRSDGIPLVFVRDVRRGSFGEPREKYVSPEKADQLRAHEARLGDVLVTKMGDPPGDASVYDSNRNAIITADVLRLRVAESVSSQYIASLFRSSHVRRQIALITRGVAQRKMSLGRFKSDVRFLVPSRVEQDNFVASVRRGEELEAGLHKAVDEARSRNAALRRTLLQAAFSGQLTGRTSDFDRAE